VILNEAITIAATSMRGVRVLHIGILVSPDIFSSRVDPVAEYPLKLAESGDLGRGMEIPWFGDSH
jgi:hypothetical protein